MNSPQQASAFSGALTREHWDVPIRVRLLPYVDFSRWLDRELDKLVSQWAAHASPRARNPRRD